MSVQVRRGIDTTSTPETVFAFATDLDRRTDWQHHLSSVEQVSPGPVTVGTRFREVSRFGKSTLEVTAHEPVSHFAYTTVGGPLEVVLDWKFTPADEGTRLDVVLSLAPRGWMKLIWPLVKRLALPQVRRDFAELERTVKALDAAATPT